MYAALDQGAATDYISPTYSAGSKSLTLAALHQASPAHPTGDTARPGRSTALQRKGGESALLQWGANRRARRALLFLRYFAAGDGGGSGRRSLNSCSTINFARHSCLGRSFGSGRQDTSCCQAEKRVKKRRQHHFLGGNSDSPSTSAAAIYRYY